ncbi:cellulase family glycosylhydrolase [Lentzea guizhouensis]|uniref:cellulase family glycosylhydrolase n=1 Tax=Lentzea guizhouensis TaxID=1586287 RepID=UPI001F1C3DEA|nr:cellulase family glycosylhydrolase [Lentzea guizhouensis]
MKDGRLLDGHGSTFVMRGVNHPHSWFPNKTSQALKDIKATGANTARIVLSNGARFNRNTTADVASVIKRCKANKLICVLEVHDTTGYGEQSGASSLTAAVNYWISIKSALAGQQRYVLLNIGNEPRGNNNPSAWVGETKSAIARMRKEGLTHTLVADGPNWGQDWSFVMRDNAKQIFNSDVRRNTVFSVHMYEVFGTADKVNNYLNRFAAARLPIVVGEFGHWHGNASVDEDAIFAASRRLGTGFLAWSWSGNGGGLDYLDLVRGFDAGKPTWWGQRTISGPNGIKATSRQASVFK